MVRRQYVEGNKRDRERCEQARQTERESERETVGLYPNWRGSWPIAYSPAQCLGLEVRRGRRIEKVYAVMGFVSR